MTQADAFIAMFPAHSGSPPGSSGADSKRRGGEKSNENASLARCLCRLPQFFRASIDFRNGIVHTFAGFLRAHAGMRNYPGNKIGFVIFTY